MGPEVNLKKCRKGGIMQALYATPAFDCRPECGIAQHSSNGENSGHFLRKSISLRLKYENEQL